jgi:DNA-binding CsgD family transcriptional regulator
MIEVIARDAERVRTVDEYKDWTRARVRPFLPHAALGSGYGHMRAGGLAFDYAVTVDCPPSHFDGVGSRAGGIDSPLLRRWLATREPQLLELKNAASHGVYDAEHGIATYHSFQRIPGPLGAVHAQALQQLVPVMHDALCRVIGLLNLENRFVASLARLSAREREIARWVRIGKTNSEIASVYGLSENTVKHHMTSIFEKLAVQNRAELAVRLVEHEARAAPGAGTRLL